MHQETSNTQSLTHSRLAEHGSRQAIMARPDHPDRVVSPSRGVSYNMQQVALAMGSGHAQLAMGPSGRV